MKEKTKKKIEEIIGQMSCPKDFKCAKSGFKYLCMAKDIGLKSHLLCIEKAPFECGFSLSVDKDYYCACPLRVYLAQHLENSPDKENTEQKDAPDKK